MSEEEVIGDNEGFVAPSDAVDSNEVLLATDADEDSHHNHNDTETGTFSLSLSKKILQFFFKKR